MRILKTVLGLVFLGAGAAKLAGRREFVEAFRRWGYPRWMRLATGAGEVGGASLLLNPSTSRAGAIDLAALMTGAVFTHLRTPGEARLALVPMALVPLLGWMAWKGGRASD